MRSLDQQRGHHLGACDTCKTLVSPAQTYQVSLSFTKIAWWFISTLRFEKHGNILNSCIFFLIAVKSGGWWF